MSISESDIALEKAIESTKSVASMGSSFKPDDEQLALKQKGKELLTEPVIREIGSSFQTKVALDTLRQEARLDGRTKISAGEIAEAKTDQITSQLDKSEALQGNLAATDAVKEHIGDQIKHFSRDETLPEIKSDKEVSPAKDPNKREDVITENDAQPTFSFFPESKGSKFDISNIFANFVNKVREVTGFTSEKETYRSLTRRAD